MTNPLVEALSKKKSGGAMGMEWTLTPEQMNGQKVSVNGQYTMSIPVICVEGSKFRQMGEPMLDNESQPIPMVRTQTENVP